MIREVHYHPRREGRLVISEPCRCDAYQEPRKSIIETSAAYAAALITRYPMQCAGLSFAVWLFLLILLLRAFGWHG